MFPRQSTLRIKTLPSMLRLSVCFQRRGKDSRHDSNLRADATHLYSMTHWRPGALRAPLSVLWSRHGQIKTQEINILLFRHNEATFQQGTS
jgi:hypothetical protein